MEKPRTGAFVVFTILAVLVGAGSSEEKAEQTTGTFYDWGSTDGVNFFAPTRGSGTYLVDNEGKELHSWEEPDLMVLGGSTFLTEEGTLLRAARSTEGFFDAPPFAMGRLREYNTKGECIWEFRYSSSLYMLGLDFVVLPNGNIMASATENHPWFNAKLKGFTGEKESNPNGYRSYTLVEVPRTGVENPEYDPVKDQNMDNTCQTISNGDDIVWKWDAFDHSLGKQSSGTWDINETFSITSVDYLPERDHILISCFSCGELFIIDHSVNYRKVKTEAGNFIYRYGNPENYGCRGKQLFKAFYAIWVRDDFGWDFSDKQTGSIVLFNNQDPFLDGVNSSVIEFTPPFKKDYGYGRNRDGSFGPDELEVWTVKIQEKIEADKQKGGRGYYRQTKYNYPWRKFFSEVLGFVQKLPNNNYVVSLSNQPAPSEAIELHHEWRSVWKYVPPYYNDRDLFGPGLPDKEAGEFEDIPICEDDLDRCNSFPLMIRYSKDFKGIKEILK